MDFKAIWGKFYEKYIVLTRKPFSKRTTKHEVLPSNGGEFHLHIRIVYHVIGRTNQKSCSLTRCAVDRGTVKYS